MNTYESYELRAIGQEWLFAGGLNDREEVRHDRPRPRLGLSPRAVGKKMGDCGNYDFLFVDRRFISYFQT